MSDQKEFEKFLRGEYYPGAPKTPWRIAMEADFDRRGVSFDSRPIPQKRVIAKTAPVIPKIVKERRRRTNSEYMKERRAAAKEKGLCCDCYKVLERGGKTNCVSCQAVRTAREVNRWKSKKVAA